MSRVILFVLAAAVLVAVCHSSVYAYTAEVADRCWSDAEVLRKQRKYAEAARKYERSAWAEKASVDPRLLNLANELWWAGACRYLLRQYDKSLEHFQQALKISRKIDDEANVATCLNNIGAIYKALGQHDKALERFQRALAIDRNLGKEAEVAVGLSNIGEVYRAWGQYGKALEHFQRALEISRKIGDEANVASCLNVNGRVYFALGQYDKALERCQRALAIARKLGQEAEVAVGLNNMGAVYQAWGQYDKALEHFQRALAIDRKLGKETEVAVGLSNIGAVYRAWGQYDKALEHYQQALAIDRKLGNEANVDIDLSNIGAVYRAWGQYDKALEHYQRALAIARKLGQEAEVAAGLNSIGTVRLTLGQYDKALEHFQLALAIYRRLGKEAEVAGRLNNIGQVYGSWGQHDKALEHYRQALAIARKRGQEANVAIFLNNIGGAHYALGEHAEAASDFRRSIDIKEKLRLTATGSLRMDYIASQVHTYKWLMLSCIRNNDPRSAFGASEMASAKYLAEKLGSGDAGDRVVSASTDSCQSGLSGRTAIVKFANIDWRGTIRLVVSSETVDGAVVESKEFISGINLAHAKEVKDTFIRLRGIRVKEEPSNDATGKQRTPLDFDKIVNYYRYLLASDDQANLRQRGIKAVRRKGDRDAAGRLDDISRKLYTFLFGDIEEYLKDKTELIILPDGILGFLPFETLIMPDGRLMGEKYDIRYAQSMTVQHMIGKRRHPKDRRQLLAMGGAVYEAKTYDRDMITSEAQLLALNKQARYDLTRSASMRGYYGKLGYGAWENLPGTLAEANEVGKLMSGARALRGKNLTESNIKKMSASGNLAKYKVLHIATHGLVVPEMPELSAVVLSQGIESEEDGYLRASEIAQLDLKADFVCLSACETGLGKIYGGEGVVGLTQTFLVAGANGLCVSLWQVADESTKTFMVEMYRMVTRKNKSYTQAIADTKRKFIAGDFGERYKDPYYWAPFVYYGAP